MFSFLDQVRHARDAAELEHLFSQALADLGFRQWAYQVVHADTIVDEEPLILTTYPEEWHAHYAASGYHLIDPVVRLGPRQVTPFQWSALSFGIEPTPDQQRMFDEAAEFGVAEGVGIPIHGPHGALAMAAMVTDEPPESLARLMIETGHEVHLISLAFHNALRDLGGFGRARQAPMQLSARERECLLWYAKGKSMWEIAAILRISRRTVDYYMENVRRKLGTANSMEAVLRATMSGLINP